MAKPLPSQHPTTSAVRLEPSAAMDEAVADNAEEVIDGSARAVKPIAEAPVVDDAEASADRRRSLPKPHWVGWSRPRWPSGKSLVRIVAVGSLFGVTLAIAIWRGPSAKVVTNVVSEEEEFSDEVSLDSPAAHRAHLSSGEEETFRVPTRPVADVHPSTDDSHATVRVNASDKGQVTPTSHRVSANAPLGVPGPVWLTGGIETEDAPISRSADR